MKPYKGARPGGSKGKGKGKKKRSGPVIDAFGGEDEGGANPKKNTKPSKAERKKSRSPVGFLVAAAVAVGGLVLTLYTSAQSKKESDSLLRSMRRKPLTVTDHAACRMECRFVTKKDVMESLYNGRVNRRKSDLGLRPCKKVVVDAVRSVTPIPERQQ